MFQILRQSLATGIVTTAYPAVPADLSALGRGRPEIDFAHWKDARPAAEVCPTGALTCQDQEATRRVRLDLGKCTFCGLCAEVDSAIRMTNECELAVTDRRALQIEARYRLTDGGTHHRLLEASSGRANGGSVEKVGADLQSAVRRILGRSLHIREVDAGSCNGCEVEIVGLNSPVYDLERFGIHFVASPRHADLLLVTGPVTRNMELALRKTYEATPDPRLVVAVGTCGCSGGIFGQNYASCGGIDQVLPVDVYIPGCPPNPHALLHGILVAVGRLEQKLRPTQQTAAAV
jgi:Ni,Fe-hydrogenase III small subunit/formate hydrogenlyase subunit 6/NADH:ubiquinone oxidoreductase subunit I